MSSPSNPPPLEQLISLARRLVTPGERREAARELAGLFGAQDLLIAIHDSEVDSLLPAPGFPQTLPDGAAWHAFFAEVASHGVFAGQLCHPDSSVLEPAAGIAAEDRSQVVLLGGAPRTEHLSVLCSILPLVAASLRGEVAAGAASAHAELAFKTASEAEALASTLDRARLRLETLAAENGRLYREAQEAIRTRDEFLAIASHELRNPVAGIAGTVQLLRRAKERGNLDEARLGRYLATIEQTGQRLAVLTEDLLDVSRLQRGDLALRLRETDLAELVRGVVHRQEVAAASHQIALQVDSEPCGGDLDPDRVEQIVENLLSNAIKYSPDDARIDVALGWQDGGLLLSVSDRGIGIPPDMLERIFEPFGRAPNASERNIPGLGLGLYICRQIAVRHGGKLWAESKGGGLGTAFYLWLPENASDGGTGAARARR